MKKYLITSPKTYNDLHAQIQKHSPDYILYRDKSNENYKEGAKKFVEGFKKYENIKLFLHQDVELAHVLHVSGVHLTSLQFSEITRAKELGLEVIVSTHTHEEVLHVQSLGADAVTYSPIFHSPNKGEPKGIDDLKKLLDICTIKVFALGGIVDENQVKQVQEVGAYGFASIRYFI